MFLYKIVLTIYNDEWTTVLCFLTFIFKQILIDYMLVINWSILSIASDCIHRFFSLPCDIFWGCSSCRWCGKPLVSYLVPYWKMPVLSAIYWYSKILFVYLDCHEKSIDWLEWRFDFSQSSDDVSWRCR